MTQPLAYAALPAHHAATRPDGVAVSDGQGSLTWSQLDQRTSRAARALIARGVRPDDLVTIVLPNGTAFIEACFACWKAGATPQPVSARLPPAELNGVIALARPPVIIAESGLDVDGLSLAYAALLEEGADAGSLPDHVAAAGKAATSGGSTGRPKLIVDTRPALIDAATAAAWRLDGDSIALMPGPLYHSGPFVSAVNALAAGAHLVIMGRYDSEAVLRQVHAHRATWLYLVPTMMHRIWRLEDEVKARYDLSSLRTLWHLAAPCPAWLKEAWIDWLGPETIWELYAASEGIAGTVINGQEWLTHRGSVGRVFAGHIQILDDDGEAVPPGVIGEVFMKPGGEGAQTFRYIGAESRARGDWQSLGDMGHFDEEGYLYLADRRTDMILVGGANVYPAEIEAAIEAHPLVESCAVIGLPDEDLGARIHAIVQPREGLATASLHSFLSERLVIYKQPRSIEFVDQPLRDIAGKVRRSQLRAERLEQGDF